MNRLGLLAALATCALVASSTGVAATETPAPVAPATLSSEPQPAETKRVPRAIGANGPLGRMVENGRANEGGIVYVKRPGRESDL